MHLDAAPNVGAEATFKVSFCHLTTTFICVKEGLCHTSNLGEMQQTCITFDDREQFCSDFRIRKRRALLEFKYVMKDQVSGCFVSLWPSHT